MKELNENLLVVILCAGTGTRFRKNNIKGPKSLIQIQSMGNKPLLGIIIDNLLSQGLDKIIVILGYKGKRIESYISNLKRQDSILSERIITINAHPEYKKGPLFTFLTLLDNPEIRKNQNNLLVFPGDTIFDQVLLNDLLSIIIKQIQKIQGRALIFYTRIKACDIKKKSPLISNVTTIKSGDIEVMVQIEEIELSTIKKDTYMNQMIPMFFLNYEFLLLISQILKSSDSNKISEVLNEICKRNLQDILACEINSKGSFYDIDTALDLEYLNKKKSGQ
jgi:NDP-sugar pyrophosphorylase family protein